MITGRPGAQVICSTGRFWSSQMLAEILTGLPLASSLGVPLALNRGIGGWRSNLLTLLAGHNARVGVKM